MSEFFKSDLFNTISNMALRIVLALLAFVVGVVLIRWLIRFLKRENTFPKMDKTLKVYIISAVKIILYTGLIISFVSILGVPTASIITVLASIGVAIGLALQGALSNFAGGVMIILFKPFKVDDYIEANGVEGQVIDISIFYTKLLTIDNMTVTIP
ncbi:MAG: mechanosensitive ion channel, partial [Enterococcus sp.]|nr:mechanosensitive ion channel [Enterococcus sp.]